MLRRTRATSLLGGLGLISLLLAPHARAISPKIARRSSMRRSISATCAAAAAGSVAAHDANTIANADSRIDGGSILASPSAAFGSFEARNGIAA